MIRTSVTVAVFCALALSLPSLGDVLVLNDGREYRGVILSQDENVVRFEAHPRGMRMTMNVPRSDIKSLRQERRSESASPNLPTKNTDVIDAAIDESDSTPDDLKAHAADRVTAAPVEFRSSKHGYSLEVPAGWEPIPNHVVREAVILLQADRSTIHVDYEAAFQPTTSSGWFESAYVLVQVMPYSAFGNTRQPYEHEITKIVQALSGLDLEELVIDNATDLGRALLGDIETAAPTVDTKNHRFTWSGEQRLPDGSSMAMLAMGNFGTESLVQIFFYAASKDWDLHATARSNLFSSFRFKPSHAYDGAKATPPPSIAKRNTSNSSSSGLHQASNRDNMLAVNRAGKFIAIVLLGVIGHVVFRTAMKSAQSNSTSQLDAPQGLHRE